jgi:hypothetical protein
MWLNWQATELNAKEGSKDRKTSSQQNNFGHSSFKASHPDELMRTQGIGVRNKVCTQ